MSFVGEARKLEDEDIRRAAASLDCDEAAVRAVAAVESRGGGFLRDGRPKILFEAHVFARRTDHAYNRSHPNISSRRWNRNLYGPGGAHQYRRLLAALALNENAAICSASWGMFQIMGFNFEACGYRSVRSFTEAMKRSEGDHLMAMVGYVQYHRLDLALRNHDWAVFAEGYNGPGFRENKYDEKLEKAWRKHAKNLPSLTARQIQAALNRAGARPRLAEDGMIGPKTRRAIRAFQRAEGVRVTGSAGPATIEALLAARADSA